MQVLLICCIGAFIRLHVAHGQNIQLVAEVPIEKDGTVVAKANLFDGETLDDAMNRFAAENQAVTNTLDSNTLKKIRKST